MCRKLQFTSINSRATASVLHALEQVGSVPREVLLHAIYAGWSFFTRYISLVHARHTNFTVQ